MTRDDLILSCQDTVNNLVRKYNNHKSDEDLQAVGMTAVIECVDRCIDDGLTDENQVQARCNRWARNAILNEIYNEKIKYVYDDSIIESLETEEDLWETIATLKTMLSPRDIEVLDLLLQGCSINEGHKKLGIVRYTFIHHMMRIKKKLKSLLVTKS